MCVWWWVNDKIYRTATANVNVYKCRELKWNLIKIATILVIFLSANIAERTAEVNENGVSYVTL